MSAFTFGGTNLKKGASGDTVKKIQEALNTHGYSLGVDGIWGDKTDSAIRDFQSKNGLDVDGIYGVNTHNSLFGIAGTNAPSKPQAPDSYSDIDLGKYDSGYQKSDDVLGAEQKKTDAENAVNNYGDFSYANQGNFDEIMNKILNREQFSFDLNGNALYQQYKDKYTQQGKMAMQDTMGQAAAMTGGYGSSYASTAGNQAYQASLENLNDVIPELYQMALDKYNQEGQDLYNQYGMLSDDRNMQYGMWGDKRNQLVAERDYYGNEANNAYAKEYGQWADQRDFDTNQYWNETNFGYGQHRDEVADWENERSFQEAKRQFEANLAEQQRQHNESMALSREKMTSNDTEKETEPEKEPIKEDGSEYVGWNASQWNSYFAQIRQSEGQSAAEEELNYFTSQGWIPKNLIVAAASGARGGKLGH